MTERARLQRYQIAHGGLVLDDTGDWFLVVDVQEQLTASERRVGELAADCYLLRTFICEKNLHEDYGDWERDQPTPLTEEELKG